MRIERGNRWHLVTAGLANGLDIRAKHLFKAEFDFVSLCSNPSLSLYEIAAICSFLVNTLCGFNCKLCTVNYYRDRNKYRVFLKKVLHKREGKMREKLKMTQQEDENLIQGQQHCSVYLCTKIILKSCWLIWPFECLIMTILTIAKYHKNLLRDSTLSVLFMVKLFSSLETRMILKTRNETFLRITRYIFIVF